ncbi:hypothetical protein, partial [Bradyrhizobium sp. Leo121]|uniref:hypothetical protein n=1 Tax=Bradyrhizobium sp. Leo121 TaxID=1571195 RepID=UPI001A919DD9
SDAELGQRMPRERELTSSRCLKVESESIPVIASAAKQSIAPLAEKWIASLRSTHPTESLFDI